MIPHATADTHFGHDKIINVAERHFGSVEEMDETVLDGINSTVPRDGVLWILGDFSLLPIAQARKYRSRIRCRQIHFIYGNHDRAGYKEFFTTAQDVKMLKYRPDWEIWLSHYPHVHWPKSHRGSLHLYGHRHFQSEAWLDEVMPGRRSMDVGMDAAKAILGTYRPFSFKEVVDILGSRPCHERQYTGPMGEDDETIT